MRGHSSGHARSRWRAWRRSHWSSRWTTLSWGGRVATPVWVEALDDAVMEEPLDPIMSPLVWDLAHIAAYEDLWAVHRLAGDPLLHDELAATYDAFETPRAVRGEIELLDRPQALRYMEDVRSRT